jgi:putative permease
MRNISATSFTSSVVKAIVFAVGLAFSLWFMYTVTSTVLLILFCIVSAMILNGPVTRLEGKHCPRPLAVAIVFLLIFLTLGLMIWLIIPIVNDQLQNLLHDLPVYIDSFERKLAAWKMSYFHSAGKAAEQGNETSSSIPSFDNVLQKLGSLSISLIQELVIGLVLVSLIIYMVLYPRPLLKFYLSAFPLTQREKATNVFTKTSSMLQGWMRANLIAGVVEAVAIVIFLNTMNVPGSWVWAMLAVVGQYFPRIGFYLMSVPPTLVAFSNSPWTALWVFVFYIVLAELASDLLMPKLRATSMNLHPVSSILALLLMGAAFGFIGIFLAIPAAAFFKAFYEEFYMSRLPVDEKLENRIDQMMLKR